MRNKLVIGALSVLLVLLTAAGGLTGYVFMTYKNAVQDANNAFSKPSEDDKPKPPVLHPPQEGDGDTDTDEEQIPKYIYNDDLVNILLLGYDDYEKRQEERGSPSYRSDTIILASVNLKTKEAFMITIPRDTRTMVQKLNKDGSIKSEGLDKIGHATAYNGGKLLRGYKNSMDAVSKLLGQIPIDYYVGMNLDNFSRIVDSVGGVPMNVEVEIPRVGLTKGQQVLTGDKALSYVRERKFPGADGSDIARTKRQKKFIKAFLEKVKGMGPIKVATNLFPSVVTYVDTNLNLEQVISLATVLKDMDISEIDTHTVPGDSQMLDLSYWIVDQQKLNELIHQLYFIENPDYVENSKAQ